MVDVDIESFVRANFTVVTDGTDEWDCLCPWHGDKTPSLRINIKKGLYFCHGCHEKGSVERLAKSSGTELRQATLQDQLSQMVEKLYAPAKRDRTYRESMLAQYIGNDEYWRKMRGLSQDVIDRFQLGQDDIEKSAIVPMRSYTGDLIGVIKRRFGNVRPKYLYPPGMRKADHLYGAWELSEGDDTVVLVEGSVDALAMWDAGVPALAILGSYISDKQVEILKRLGIWRVVIFTDNDSAGETSCQQIIETLPSDITWGIALYQDDWGTDPASLTPSQRREAFREAVWQFDFID